MEEGILAVTGGTGCYAGAKATMTLKATSEEYTSYDWKFIEPPSSDECESLLETLGDDSTIFQENNGGETKGDYETPGTLDYWFGNRLYSGSHDGTLIPDASSVGECTLLTNVAEFSCLEQWIIDGDKKSTIVATGYSPNSFEVRQSFAHSSFLFMCILPITLSITGFQQSGTLAISGTGCFTGIKGGMSITAESITEDYDFFSYEIKSTNEDDKSNSGVPEIEPAIGETTTDPTTTGPTTTGPTTVEPGTGPTTVDINDPEPGNDTEPSRACMLMASFSVYFVVSLVALL